MKNRVIILTIALLSSFLMALIAKGSPHGQSSQVRGTVANGSGELEQMKESWERDHQSLVAYEREQSKMRAEVIRRRKLYQGGQISKAEVVEAEQSLVNMLTHIYELRRSMMESDLAITEATMKDELVQMPDLPVNGFNESDHLSRFNGGAKWSLKEAPRIERFFSRTFGRSLPVTAFGQTATHSHMRFDHHEAIDVGLHPDSTEGKALIKYLRDSGIPFIAYRGAVPGASTGAHIHIGQPSHRLAAN